MTKIKAQLFPFLPTLLFSVLHLPHITLPLRLDPSSAKIQHTASVLRTSAGPLRHAWIHEQTAFVGSTPLSDGRLAPSSRNACKRPHVSGLDLHDSLSLERLFVKKGVGFARRIPHLGTLRDDATCLSAKKKDSPEPSKGKGDAGKSANGQEVKRVKSPITGRLINVNGPSFMKVMELGYALVGDEMVHRNCVDEANGKSAPSSPKGSGAKGRR